MNNNYYAQPRKPTSDLHAIVQDYFDRMIREVKGIKSLVLDKETSGMISLVISQTAILERDVYLIKRIEASTNDQMTHLKGLYFVRPTDKNFEFILEQLE